MTSEPVTRVALVTGGARGIGAAIAAALRTDGFRVVTMDINDLDSNDLDSSGLPDGDGPDGEVHIVGDVSRADDVAAAVAATVERHGRLDAVVNNAAIIDVHAVEDTTEEVWDRVMAVNVKSVYLVSRAALPHLRRAGRASIVNVASVHAVATMQRTAAYAASKGAVLSLTRQMALDLYDDGIRVNAVVVGSIDTVMGAAHGAGLARAGITVPTPPGAIGRTGAPSEIGAAVSFLVSDRASFVTGAPLIVDGGMLARLM